MYSIVYVFIFQKYEFWSIVLGSRYGPFSSNIKTSNLWTKYYFFFEADSCYKETSSSLFCVHIDWTNCGRHILKPLSQRDRLVWNFTYVHTEDMWHSLLISFSPRTQLSTRLCVTAEMAIKCTRDRRGTLNKSLTY